jgi:indole-3-glycerol phosphate synthase
VAPFSKLFEGKRTALLAEIKPVSPALGRLLGEDTDMARLAAEYERGGADALSVLTEPDHFGGSYDLLARVAARTSLPLLAKDVTVHPAQIRHARAAGASSVLLVTESLEEGELAALIELSRSLGMEPLVEVHDRAAVTRALAAGARIIGVNSRDLATLRMNHRAHETVIKALPSGVIPVAASGIESPDQIVRLRRIGYRGFLIGTALARAPFPQSLVREMADALGGEK